MDLNSTPKELQNFEAVLDLVVPLKTVTCSGIGWPFCQTFGWTGLNCWNLSERSQKNSDLNSGFGQNYFFDSGLGQNYFSDIDSGSGQNFSDSGRGQFFSGPSSSVGHSEGWRWSELPIPFQSATSQTCQRRSSSLLAKWSYFGQFWCRPHLQRRAKTPKVLALSR